MWVAPDATSSHPDGWWLQVGIADVVVREGGEQQRPQYPSACGLWALKTLRFFPYRHCLSTILKDWPHQRFIRTSLHIENGWQSGRSGLPLTSYKDFLFEARRRWLAFINTIVNGFPIKAAPVLSDLVLYCLCVCDSGCPGLADLKIKLSKLVDKGRAVFCCCDVRLWRQREHLTTKSIRQDKSGTWLKQWINFFAAISC